MYTHFYYDRIIVYDGQNGSFEGEVADVKYYSGDNALYTLKGKINGVQPAKINYYGNVLNADYGDIVRLEDCKFSVPESTYLFDSESYYKADGIFLDAGYCSSVSTEKMKRKIFRKALMSYREKMISKFKISLGDSSGDFLAGMVFGEKQGMSDNLKTSLYRCGIGHILAVSGLHISIIAMAVMGFLKRLRVNKYVSFGLVNAVMLLFISMANYPVSAVKSADYDEFSLLRKAFQTTERYVQFSCRSHSFNLYFQSLCNIQQRLSSFNYSNFRYRRFRSVYVEKFSKRFIIWKIPAEALWCCYAHRFVFCL